MIRKRLLRKMYLPMHYQDRLYQTGASKNPIILYDYQKTRSSSYPKDFLKL